MRVLRSRVWQDRSRVGEWFKTYGGGRITYSKGFATFETGALENIYTGYFDNCQRTISPEFVILP